MIEVANEAPIADGIHLGLSREQYERIEAANYSTLKHFGRSPAHAREYMLHPAAPTDAMELGTAEHCAVFEPTLFGQRYVEAPKVDRRTAAGKTTWAEFDDSHRGMELLSVGEMEACREMAKSVYAHDVAKRLMSSPGKNEVTIVWTDPHTGVRCKARLDRITVFAGWTVVVDLKTCRDASPAGFPQQVARLQYEEQAAFYLWGLEILAPANRRWFWVAVENERPYCVATHEPDEDTLQTGRMAFREHLNAFAHCQQTNIWPGYPALIHSLRLPKWRLAQMGDVTNGVV